MSNYLNSFKENMKNNDISYTYKFVSKKCINNTKKENFYRFTASAHCLKTKKLIDFFIDFTIFKNYIYVCDLYPASWVERSDCFKRLTSNEGLFFNYRKLSVTGLTIYNNSFFKENTNTVFAVIGSYIVDEPKTGPSQKTKILWKMMKPLLGQFKMRAILIWELNVFILVHKNSKISNNKKIISDFCEIKKLAFPSDIQLF